MGFIAGVVHYGSSISYNTVSLHTCSFKSKTSMIERSWPDLSRGRRFSPVVHVGAQWGAVVRAWDLGPRILGYTISLA